MAEVVSDADKFGTVRKRVGRVGVTKPVRCCAASLFSGCRTDIGELPTRVLEEPMQY